MQYRTTCNNCGREYMVNGNPGQTIRAKCPYCGSIANVVTPATYVNQSNSYVEPVQQFSRPPKRKSSKPLYMKVTIWFLIVVTVLFVLLSVLYLIFTGMTK